MRKKNFWAGIEELLTVCAALGLGGCQRENQKIRKKQKPVQKKLTGQKATERKTRRQKQGTRRQPEAVFGSRRKTGWRRNGRSSDSASRHLAVRFPFQQLSAVFGFVQSYTWNMKGQSGFPEGVVACGAHPLEMNADALPLYVTDYHQITQNPYLVSCPVMPDQSGDQLGSFCPGRCREFAEEMVVYEHEALIELKAGKVYALTAVWERRGRATGIFRRSAVCISTDSRAAWPVRAGETGWARTLRAVK